MEARERIILALDVDTEKKALELVEKLIGSVGAFKVGMQLYNICGPLIVHRIQELGGRVFVDLKFHDIPNTVAAAARVMTGLNCFMFNVHAAGGREMMTAAIQSAQEEASRLSCSTPLALAVTVLTSISQQQLHDDMFITDRSVEQTVVDWAQMAQECGMNGVVCSPQEIAPIRQACGSDFIIVTPGIRPLWSAKNDQKRITTPRDALELGADYMVIGRPITAAEDPREAAQKIIDELEDQ